MGKSPKTGKTPPGTVTIVEVNEGQDSGDEGTIANQPPASAARGFDVEGALRALSARFDRMEASVDRGGFGPGEHPRREVQQSGGWARRGRGQRAPAGGDDDDDDETTWRPMSCQVCDCKLSEM